MEVKCFVSNKTSRPVCLARRQGGGQAQSGCFLTLIALLLRIIGLILIYILI